MERPTILLAVAEGGDAYVDALTQAGFDPVSVDPAHVQNVPHVDMGVVDCDLPPEVVTAVYQQLQGSGVSGTLLLVGVATELPEGVGAGGDEVALKPIPPDALVYRLQALLIRSGRHLPTESGAWAADENLSAAPIAGEGHVVSVFAPKGGVGKTTVAVNMAVALRQQTRSEVLLFDADVGVGNVTAVLDVPYRMGLADLADSPQEEWSDAAFEQIVATHPDSGVRVLTWGTDPGESERVSVDLLLAALRWARDHHSYVIIDNHPGYDDRTMAMLAVSNEIFLVVTPGGRRAPQQRAVPRAGTRARPRQRRPGHREPRQPRHPRPGHVQDPGPADLGDDREQRAEGGDRLERGSPHGPEVPAREDVGRPPRGGPAHLRARCRDDRPGAGGRQARLVDPLRDSNLRGLGGDHPSDLGEVIRILSGRVRRELLDRDPSVLSVRTDALPSSVAEPREEGRLLRA